ncbi:MAG: hypothetical protein AB1633_01950 [Elusimicrobiota bacterium]
MKSEPMTGDFKFVFRGPSKKEREILIKKCIRALESDNDRDFYQATAAAEYVGSDKRLVEPLIKAYKRRRGWKRSLVKGALNYLGYKTNRQEKESAYKKSNKVYTLDVYLIGGPVTKEFSDKVVCRRIQIKGSQTLKNLHDIIFKAFARYEEHFYEFILGKGPYDRSEIYSIPVDGSVVGRNKNEGDVTKTTIESLKLEVNRAFGYRFDFGDDWLHQINVVAIKEHLEKKKYPRIIKRTGKSPPQYPDIEDKAE